MGTKTGNRASGSAGAKKKKSKTPKFLLVKDADREEAEAALLAEAAGAEAESTAVEDREPPEDPEISEDDDFEAWPGREGIRDGLVDQVSARFGIPQDVAIRAVNDMLRLS